jgi:hypothetical protein
MKRLLLLSLLFAGFALCQTTTSTLSTAARIRRGAALPAGACVESQVFYLMGALGGQYVCNSAGVWVLAGARASTELSDSGGLVRGAGSMVTPGAIPVVSSSGELAEWAPITISTSSPVTPSGGGFYLNNSAGNIVYNLPSITTATVGRQYCFRNYTTRTGTITLQLPASTYADVDGANGSAAGTLVSGGSAGDSACVVAASTTQYIAYIGVGAWVNN